MRKLYRFFWDCGRMGEIEGLFIAEESQVNKTIGKELYFGEILGKHSEIQGKLEMNELTVISEDQEFIDKIAGVFGTTDLCGYNPLDHINEGEE